MKREGKIPTRKPGVWGTPPWRLITSGPPATLNNSVFVYDPATDSWTTAPAMPTARAGLAAVTANGKIFALGGTTSANGDIPTSAVEEFAPPIYILVKN